ncbi:unnamed protein product [Periconia digitata]|uniref:Uracil-DNA glycosylase-like domain-containing protein n=1 Tax=Periconia digitata TaxID=1303443 RepID=A0A9W4XYC3_9PLEO|nr:unnamed protein product [Periconia digitata]
MPSKRSIVSEEEEEEEDEEEASTHPISESAISNGNTTSFRDQLSKFQYTSTSSSLPTDDSNPRRTSKRIRITKTTDATTTPLSASSSPTTSPRPPKRNQKSKPKATRQPSKYAPPTKYAHLTPLTDILTPNLICIFVGTNPGIQTATKGHAYAHPSNHFWKLLHASGLTDRRLLPEEDNTLPAKYCMGNTNIVARPSSNAAELSKHEMAAGTQVLEEKFQRYRPEAVCIVGKGIWEAIWRWRFGKNPTKDEFRYGWQDAEHNMGKSVEGDEDGKWEGARVFVTTSTSGLAAGLSMAQKEEIWRPFGEWVERRRRERGFVVGGDGDGVGN